MSTRLSLRPGRAPVIREVRFSAGRCLPVLLIWLLMTSAAAHAGKRLGRLLLTPQQRQQLEQRVTVPAPATAAQALLQIDGYLVQGHTLSLWINGQELRAGSRVRGIEVLPGSRHDAIHLRLGHRRLLAKVGDLVNAADGSVTRLVPGVHPGTPER